ncbi:sporulation protein YunB [Anaeromicrobium sediminis]|uniref:Sporulation protein YunB n=1 Tax=Anaeromicrobium sediminis TaxID=1478221 RepID=A0A267MHE7_9FIRM|nr:sporulation protein YunB [Anaeromicrobium sediminis]PAB58994.1 sporulation protein YunB [Anaeromicrobium sediminis]
MSRNKKVHKKRSFKVFISLTLILLFCIYAFVFIDKKVKPAFLTIATVKAREIATRAINESVHQNINKNIKYEDLIFIRTDIDGNITMMQANTVMMNQVASEVALSIQDNIKKIKTSSVSVPLGTVFKSQLLAKYGPRININVTPIGMSSVNFKTEFEESGINQTRHKIYLVVTTQVRIIIPFSSEAAKVQSEIPIAETVIVGKVPQNYIRIPKDEATNLIPTDLELQK